MSKIKKKKLLMYILLYLTIMSLVTVINKTKAAGHSLEIESPSDGMVITNAYRTALNSLEQTAIRFEFEIKNHDHYYALYETWIDGIYDKTLIDSGFNKWIVYFHGVFYYDAQSFLDRYGQGVHTFSLWALHPITVTVGFAEGPGPDDDVLFINGTTYRITEVSVTFTFNPPVVHFVGFWHTDDEGEWRDSILASRDFFESSNAHYLHGYSYTTGHWDDDKPGAIFKNNLSPAEDSNDIDIIMFDSHGGFNLFNKYFILCPDGVLGDKHLTGDELKNAINNAHLDSATIILAIDTCYSGAIANSFYDANIIILTACTSNETSLLSGNPSDYDSSWTLAEKIYQMSSALFFHALIQGLYHQQSLYDTFSNIHYWAYYHDPAYPDNPNYYDYDNPLGGGSNHEEVKMHPVSLNLDATTGGIIFFIQE